MGTWKLVSYSCSDEDGNVVIDEGDAAVKALEFMLSLRPYSTPGYMESTWDEEYSEMCNGNVFVMFTWGDTTPYLEIPGDCPGSAGKMTYFAHPGMGLSMAEANNWMIPKSAKNPEAAYLFAQWINRTLLLSALRRWMRAASFHNPIVWTFLPTPLARAMGPDSDHAIASSFEIAPMPSVRSLNIRLRFSRFSMSATAGGTCSSMNLRTIFINIASSGRSADVPPTRV